MFNKRKAVALVLSLLCAHLLPACALFGPGKFKLEVRADRPDKVVSMFVIAADK